MSETIDEVNPIIFSKENIIVYKDGFDKFELPPIDGVKTAYYYNLRNELAFEKLPSGRPAFLVASIIESDKSILITITPYFDDGDNFPDSLSKREPSLLKAGKTFFSGCEMSCRIGEGNFILIKPESLPMDERLFTTELFSVPKKEQFFKFYCVICGNVM